MTPEGHAGAGGWRLFCRSEGRIRVVVWADEERAMSKGLARWSMWTVVLAVAVGMSLVASAWAGEANGKTHATNVVAEVSAQGEVSAIMTRLQEVEAQLSKVEDRVEDYRRSQDNALKEMLVQWSGLLIAPFREQFNENVKKEIDSIREQSKFILDENGKVQQEAIAELRIKVSECEEKQCTNVTIWGVVLLLLLIVGFVVVCLQVRRKTEMTSCGLYRFEMILLVFIMLLISWGAYQLLSRIIDWGVSGNSIYAITSADYNQAVMQAYEQLSNEMERWVALLSIIGAFIGLVLPIGGYLLQIKTVNRQEERLDKQIARAIEEAKKEIKEIVDGKVVDAQQELDKALRQKSEEMDSKLTALRKQQVDFAKILVSDLAQKVLTEWKNGRDGADIGSGLVYCCTILDDCSVLSADESEMKSAAMLILRIFNGLKEYDGLQNHWHQFAPKMAEISKRFNISFHVNEALIGADYFARWKELCAELGIKVVEC